MIIKSGRLDMYKASSAAGTAGLMFSLRPFGIRSSLFLTHVCDEFLDKPRCQSLGIINTVKITLEFQVT